MPDVNEINGTDAVNTLAGTTGADLIYGFDPNGPQGDVTSIWATRVATGLTRPLFATVAPNDDGRLFIIEKGGLIKILDLQTGEVSATPFLDVSAEIATAGEQGLLGLAFHPDFARNGKFYVNLSRKVDGSTVGDTEIREYTVSAADPNRADGGSGRLIIRIDQPELQNHKAGWIDFGPDGHLYVATGDGGGAGDPGENAQDVNSLLGKVLRLDIDRDGFPSDPDRNYATPADNPFVGQAGADEIWALGLRNPFRNSFDRGTGDLFIADVGQGAREEIDLGALGANYGWDLFEGSLPYEPGPTPPNLTAPIFEYSHPSDGGRSITGGYVYRGSSDGLHGQYFFADFVSGQVWTIRQDANGAWTPTERTAQIRYDVGGPIGNPASFGEDAEGNLYVVSIGGDIHRLDPVNVSADRGDRIDAGEGDDGVYAGTGSDTVRGGAGDDRLYGMGGHDLLAGGAGADALFGGRGVDGASYALAGAGVTASLVRERANRGEAAGDSFSGIEVLIGSRFGDRLYGDEDRNALAGLNGDDRLSGGRGADAMNGGGGSDLYVVDDRGDSVVERAGLAGTDAVHSFISFSLSGTAVENLRLLGSADIDGTGSALSNRLTGNGADNTLTGGLGADVLLGGRGADTFRFAALGESTLAPAGQDTVLDFSRAQGDRIDLSAIDADAGTSADDAFAVRATLADAQADAGSIYVKTEGGARVAFLNVDADATFEMAIRAVGGLGEGDFLL